MATFHSYMNSMNITLELHFCCVLCFLPNVSGKDLNIIDSHKKMRPHSALWKQWKFHLDIQETFIRVLLMNQILTMTLKRILLVKLAAVFFFVCLFLWVSRDVGCMGRCFFSAALKEQQLQGLVGYLNSQNK